MAPKPGKPRGDSAFPTWGAIVLPGCALWGTLLGLLAGAFFGNALIGMAIGAGLGIGIGFALFAAAVVVAASRH